MINYYHFNWSMQVESKRDKRDKRDKMDESDKYADIRPQLPTAFAYRKLVPAYFADKEKFDNLTTEQKDQMLQRYRWYQQNEHDIKKAALNEVKADLDAPFDGDVERHQRLQRRRKDLEEYCNEHDDQGRSYRSYCR
jgi:hypothetical protein